MVLLYVDDVLADGNEDDIVWIWMFGRLDEDFDCKEDERLTADSVLDYLGMDLSIDEEHIMLSMTNYIDKTLEIMDMVNIKVALTPISAHIKPSEPLDIRRHKLH